MTRKELAEYYSDYIKSIILTDPAEFLSNFVLSEEDVWVDVDSETINLRNKPRLYSVTGETK